MNKILILCPRDFLCSSKFNRKAESIVSRLSEYEIIFPQDWSGLIRNYFSKNNTNARLIEKKEWTELGITHAIIFDDGEEFQQEMSIIEEMKIPFRFVRIKITRVVNVKKELQFSGLKQTDNYEYIGRGSYWGNPYSMFGTGDDREEVIRKFKYDFDFEKFPNKKKSEVFKLAGKRLGCFCEPEKCHGDVLAEYLNSWDDGL